MSDEVRDLTGRVTYTGTEPHPYRTSTRFRRVNGKWEPIAAAKDRRQPKRFTTAEERADGRAQAETKAKAERKAMAKITKRIEKRQSIGDPMCRQSEGEDFPLMEALRREGNGEAIAIVLRYRRLVALCEAEPLKGLDYSKRDGGEIVRVSRNLTPEADIDAAAASDWQNVPDGEIKQSSKIKKSKGAYASVPKRTVVADNDNAATGSVIKTESLHVKLTDEILNEHIDAKPVLAKLRYALGPLVEPFEDVVLGGKSYTDIGKRQGEGAKPAVAGKAIVGMAIGCIKVAWQESDATAKIDEAVALSRFRRRAA
jgi:hypothetical protein